MQVTGIEGSGPTGIAIWMQNSGAITTAANGGTVTLIGNSMLFYPDITISAQPGSSVTLRPFTAGVAINLGLGARPNRRPAQPDRR